MKLSRLKPASDYDVRMWLVNRVGITKEQDYKIGREELLRYSGFVFYQIRKQRKVSFLWRLTLILFPIFFLIIFIFNPIKWMVTGKWGYGSKFMDKYYHGWLAKLNL